MAVSNTDQILQNIKVHIYFSGMKISYRIISNTLLHKHSHKVIFFTNFDMPENAAHSQQPGLI